MKNRLRRMSVVLACACLSMLAVTVSGCSGGSGGAPAPTTPLLTPADFWPYGLSRSGPGPDTLLVIDPDQPGTPRLSVSVDEHWPTISIHYDTASSTITYLGQSMVYFVRNHQLFQVSLRKESATVAQRISSIDTACDIVDWHPLRFDGGDDAWVQVTDAGADGDCGLSADNRQVFVRTGTSSTTAATALPDGVELVESLPVLTPAGSAVFLMSDARGAEPKLVLYGTGLVPLGDVAGGAGLSSLNGVDGFPLLRGGSASNYVRSGMSLRRLTWTGTSASLTPPLYAFESAALADDNSTVAFNGTNGTVFVDGLKVKRIDAAGDVATLASLDPSAGDRVTLQTVTPSHLVLAQSWSSGNQGSTLLSLPAAGGTATTLASDPAIAFFASGLAGGDVVYAVQASFGQDFTVHRVDVQGHNDRVVVRGVGYPDIGYSRVANPSVFPLSVETVTWCEPAAGEPDCSKGTLKFLNLASGASTTLGQFTNPAATWYSPLSFFDEPTVIQAYLYDPATFSYRTDIYLARPGRADSLVRVTHNIP